MSTQREVVHDLVVLPSLKSPNHQNQSTTPSAYALNPTVLFKITTGVVRISLISIVRSCSQLATRSPLALLSRRQQRKTGSTL